MTMKQELVCKELTGTGNSFVGILLTNGDELNFILKSKFARPL